MKKVGVASKGMICLQSSTKIWWLYNYQRKASSQMNKQSHKFAFLCKEKSKIIQCTPYQHMLDQTAQYNTISEQLRTSITLLSN